MGNQFSRGSFSERMTAFFWQGLHASQGWSVFIILALFPAPEKRGRAARKAAVVLLLLLRMTTIMLTPSCHIRLAAAAFRGMHACTATGAMPEFDYLRTIKAQKCLPLPHQDDETKRPIRLLTSADADQGHTYFTNTAYSLPPQAELSFCSLWDPSLNFRGRPSVRSFACPGLAAFALIPPTASPETLWSGVSQLVNILPVSGIIATALQIDQTEPGVMSEQ